jgi:3-oxoacyl-[acyl-carrier-protein] synthase II
MQGHRVVVTGLGAISPLGNDPKTIWHQAKNAVSGIETITAFPVEDLPVQFGGLLKNFNVSLASPGKLAKQSSPFILYAAEVGRQAMQDACLDVSQFDPERAGVAFGSGIGGLSSIEKNAIILKEQSAKRISPFFIPGCIINSAAGRISVDNNLKGPNVSAVSACATGIHNIGLAARMIAYGDADLMLAGGSESLDSRLTIAGFAALRALSRNNDNPQQASRPFDAARDGFVLGEGACALVLESYEHAKKRGAKIYAEITGFGMSADAYHMTAPSGEGAKRVMDIALKDAGLNKEDIRHINAHATSTPVGDQIELNAIESLFGQHIKNFAVCGTKSMTGHLLGATGALECMFTIQALNDQIVPPTINLDNPIGSSCFNLVPNEAQNHEFSHALCNSVGFGGTNASLIFSHPEVV